MNKNFREQHAASLAGIAAGVDVLAARVSIDGEALTVRADQMGHALLTLHGTPTPDLSVTAQVEYFAMSSVEFDTLPDWQ